MATRRYVARTKSGAVRHGTRGLRPLERRGGTPAESRILDLQQAAGNRAVSRSLAGIQRDPAASGPPAPAPAPAQAAPGTNPAGGMDSGWAPIYKLIAEQLGEEKLKEHAKTLAGKGVDLLMAQVKDATSEQDFVAKSQVALIGTMLTAQAKKDAEALVLSDAGKALRERLLTISRESPETVVAAAIAAAAVAYMANIDMPEIAKKVELAKGLSAEGKLDIGKIQQLTVQQAKLALSYTSTHFSAGASGSYAGEGDKQGASGEANAAIGGKEFQFKAAVKVNPDGSAKLDLGQAIDISKVHIETGGTIEKDNMAAIVAVKVGGKDSYVSGKTTVTQDGKVSVDLGIKTGDFKFTGAATGLGTDKPGGEASVTASNIFGFKGLDAEGKVKFTAGGLTSASGGVTYSAETKRGTAFISFKGETVPGAEKDGPPMGAQGVIGVGFRFGK